MTRELFHEARDKDVKKGKYGKSECSLVHQQQQQVFIIIKEVVNWTYILKINTCRKQDKTCLKETEEKKQCQDKILREVT